MAKELLREGTPFILSEKLSQDPLEEHFTKHRRVAGCNDNVALPVIGQQEVSLHVTNSDFISDLRGNTSGKPDNRPAIDVNDLRLPKKRSITKK